MRDDIEERLIAVVSAATGVPGHDIGPDSRLDALSFDSLVLVELSLKLRKEFGVSAVDEELEQLETVDELLQLVKSRRTT